MSLIDAALARLNITLPPAPKPVAAYVPFVQTGKLVFVSGQLPSREGKVVCSGAVPSAVLLEDAKEAARLAVINALAVLRDAAGGDLDRVARIVRIGVFVQCDDGFAGQPAIANGASELLVAVFGEAGKHARAAVGTNALPLNATVEVEVVAELK